MKPMKCRAWDKEVNMMVEPHTINFNLKCAFYVDGNSETNRVGLDNFWRYDEWNVEDFRESVRISDKVSNVSDVEIIGNIHENPELLTQ